MNPEGFRKLEAPALWCWQEVFTITLTLPGCLGAQAIVGIGITEKPGDLIIALGVNIRPIVIYAMHECRPVVDDRQEIVETPDQIGA